MVKRTEGRVERRWKRGERAGCIFFLEMITARIRYEGGHPMWKWAGKQELIIYNDACLPACYVPRSLRPEIRRTFQTPISTFGTLPDLSFQPWEIFPPD